MPIAPGSFDVISFDCYGTLVDWESGILAAMQPVIARHELVSGPDDVLAAFARAESAVEAGAFRPYTEVLRRTFAAMAKDLGFAPGSGELETLVESLPRWPLFHDTVASLRALRSAGHRLAVISNVDAALFQATAAALEVEFEAVITAEQARCYKPGVEIFELALQRLQVAPERVLHVSASPYHDVAPARRLGLRSVLVLRDAGRRGAGATPELEDPAAAEPELCVADLAGLLGELGLALEGRGR